MDDVEKVAWIVGNNAGDKWRKWGEWGPGWTGNRAEATRYARRVDAEAVHAADEDACRIVPQNTAADLAPRAELDAVKRELTGMTVRAETAEKLRCDAATKAANLAVELDAVRAENAKLREHSETLYGQLMRMVERWETLTGAKESRQ